MRTPDIIDEKLSDCKVFVSKRKLKELFNVLFDDVDSVLSVDHEIVSEMRFLLFRVDLYENILRKFIWLMSKAAIEEDMSYFRRELNLLINESKELIDSGKIKPSDTDE